MKIGQWPIPLLILTCAIAARGSTQEKRMKRSDLPPAVQKTADRQSEGAKVLGYSSEQNGNHLEYEIAMTLHGHHRDVTIGADGTVLEIEEEVALDSLPAPIQAGLRQLAGSGKITKVESLTKHGTVVAFEAQVRTGTKRSEVQVDPDGKPLAHPE